MGIDKRSGPPVLCIVVPCYNEEEVLPEAQSRLLDELSALVTDGLVSNASHILFVDDGSKDQTWSLIENASRTVPQVRGLKLSRNRGHQTAVLAGLLEGQGDIFISIDADLQDDITAIRQMVISHIQDGTDVVYGVRAGRSSDTAFKRFTAEGYYRLLSALGVEIVFNHADYRLMSQRAISALGEYREVHLFLRGLVPLIGFKTATIEYDRSERFAGESKYPLRKMLSLAWEGVTSFSAKPLRIISIAGIVISMLAFLGALAAIWASLTGGTVEGWASLVVAVAILGGIQLLAIGLIGEYLGKIYNEVKARPRYFVDKIVGDESQTLDD